LFNNNKVRAWAFLIIALALHVLDEAVNSFLSFYNPLVVKLRTDLGFFPAPTFTFGVWIGGLIAIILLLFAITPLINRNYKTIRYFTTAFGILMIVNALGHIIGSIFYAKLIPGFWSSPLLLIAAIYFIGLRFPKKLIE
jgi:hypothetical protein